MEKETKVKDYTFVLETFLDDVLKLAKVNMMTGEYRFIKQLEEEEQLGCLKEKTINAYTQSIVDHALIHPEEREAYLYHMDRDYLRHQIAQNPHDIVYSFRRKQGKRYRWLTVQITVPKAYSEKNPWVMFSWKESDQDSKALEDAIQMLSVLYHKILKINLTKDSYEAIKVYDEEKISTCGMSLKISKWFWNFAKAGNVYEEDVEEYLGFCNLEYLREQFKRSRECQYIRYRRKMGNEFRWVMMELIPSIEYMDENQVVMLYVRDIHDSYTAELNYQKNLEYYCNNDLLTGLYNRNYYQRWCEKYLNRKHKASLGVVFADVNGLKYTNDHYGHAAGDELLKEFSMILEKEFGRRCCCRISGDEFLVFMDGVEEAEIREKFSHIHALIQAQERPIASVGYAWHDHPDNIEEVAVKAEERMYQDKEEFYKRFPELKR